MNSDRVKRVIFEAIGFAWDDIKGMVEWAAPSLWFVYALSLIVSTAVTVILIISICTESKVPFEILYAPCWLVFNGILVILWWIIKCFTRARRRLQ